MLGIVEQGSPGATFLPQNQYGKRPPRNSRQLKVLPLCVDTSTESLLTATAQAME
jgi:hypothetical protein